MKHLSRAALSSALALLITACSSPRAEFPVQRYVPVSESMQALGDLRLSNTLMGFSALKGEMKLEYAGQMPEAAGEDLAGASVYRVRNGQAYFDQNATGIGSCSEPPRWVAVNSETGAPAWSREVLVDLLTLEDWSQYTPDEHRSCAGGKYVRAGD